MDHFRLSTVESSLGTFLSASVVARCFATTLSHHILDINRTRLLCISSWVPLKSMWYPILCHLYQLIVNCLAPLLHALLLMLMLSLSPGWVIVACQTFLPDTT